MLIREYRKTPVFASFKMFAPVSAIEMLMNNALNRYYSFNDSSSNDDLSSAVTKLFARPDQHSPFEDGNGRLCRVILSHVLVQSGCSLFPCTLKLLPQDEDRKHYIRAVRRYYNNPSMLYTMVAASLVHVWDNFEQNVELLEKSNK